LKLTKIKVIFAPAAALAFLRAIFAEHHSPNSPAAACARGAAAPQRRPYSTTTTMLKHVQKLV
jgi:hypothetical protein